MSLIDRFLTAFRGEDRGAAEPPGLLLDVDGVTWLISPDGSRARVGSGGSVPATLVARGGEDGIRGTAATVACDGADHAVSLAGVDPLPSWLDIDGNIIEPGLYKFAMNVSVETPLTGAGKYARLMTPFSADWVVPIDALALGQVTVTDDFVIVESDLPYSTIASAARGQSDATGVLACLPFLTKLADATAG